LYYLIKMRLIFKLGCLLYLFVYINTEVCLGKIGGIKYKLAVEVKSGSFELIAYKSKSVIESSPIYSISYKKVEESDKLVPKVLVYSLHYENPFKFKLTQSLIDKINQFLGIVDEIKKGSISVEENIIYPTVNHLNFDI
jgi:hypothetical protein